MAFAHITPTMTPPIKPGPPVTAIASNSLKVTLAVFIASEIIWSISASDKPIRLTKVAQSTKKIDEALSVEAIKASDGKTYKFLGSQWAELFPSGKTGLFAKKKLEKNLIKLREEKLIKIPKRRKRKN